LNRSRMSVLGELRSCRIVNPVVITRTAEVEDQAAIDLVLGLLGVEAVHLRDEAEDFATDVERQVLLGEDRRVGIGECEDRDDIEIAPAGLERAAASPAFELRRIGAVGSRGIGCHGGIARITVWSGTPAGYDGR
jgi:hypothetical protein